MENRTIPGIHTTYTISRLNFENFYSLRNSKIRPSYDFRDFSPKMANGD